MKATTKVLLSSIATIAMTASVAVGGTLALFTDKAAVSVAVTSGKVDVEATVVSGSLKTSSRGIEQESGHFANDAEGVTGAVLNTDGSLKLTNITPGDKAEFKIKVTNNSNVDIRYRTVAHFSEDSHAALKSKLVWTASVTDWTYVDGSKKIDTPIDVSVELPETVTYTDLGGVGAYSANILFTVEAIQGNGDAEGTEGEDWDGSIPEEKPDTLEVDTANHKIIINDARAFAYFNTLVNDPDFSTKYGQKWRYSVELGSDIDLLTHNWTPIAMSNFIEFNGNGHTIKNLKVDTNSNHAGLFTTIASNDTGSVIVKNFTIDGAYVKGAQQVGVVAGYNPQGNFENVTVKNATVIGTKYIGGLFGHGTGNVNNCKVIDSTITIIPSTEGGLKEAGGLVGYLSNDGLPKTENTMISGNLVENVTVKAPTIASGLVSQPNTSNSGGAKIVIENNTMKNVTILTEDTTAALDASNNVGGKSIVRNNTAEACKVGAEVYGLTLITNSDSEIYGSIYVNDKEGLLNVPNLVNDWVALFSDGNGVEYNNYKNHAYYYLWAWSIELTADIDFAGAEIAPIQLGKKSYFNGNGHTISNVIVKTDATTENEAGLFIANNCGVRNLTLDNVQVTGSNVGNSTAGILSGSCNSEYNVENVTIKNSSVYGGKYTGGVIGYGYTTVTNCTVENSSVKGGYKLGGIIGYICASTAAGHNVTGNKLTNCTVDGIGGGIYAGGKDKYVVGKVVGSYNCNGICNNNTITNMTTSATANIGAIEANCTVTE